jgi:hypothetical protein
MYVMVNCNGVLNTHSNRYAYVSPELAVLIQPTYETFDHPRIFEVSGEMSGPIRLLGRFAFVRETYVPEFTLVQRIWFAIQCALAVCDDPVFVSWAENWINGTDRSKETALIIFMKLFGIISTSGVGSAMHAVNSASDFLDPGHALDSLTDAASYAAMSAAQVNPSINFTDIALKALCFDLKEFVEIDF